jgi:Na+/proline symporter
MDIQPKLDELSTAKEPGDLPHGSAELVSRPVVVVGLLGIAMVHLLDLPETIEDAPSLALAFTALIIGSLVAAELLRRRGSNARLLFSGLLAGFVLSRTIGIPGLTTDDIGNWTEPLGLASMLIEATVVWLTGVILVKRMTA